MPRADKRERSLTLRVRLTAFSNWPLSRCAPVSSPPWAASRTTTNLGAGAGIGCCAAAVFPAVNARTNTAIASLLQCIDGQAAEELREEVGGLLRHDRTGKCHFSQLLHGDGVGEKGYIGFSAAHLFHGFASVAQIADVCL